MDAVTTGAGVEDFGGCSVRRWGHAIERSRVFAAGGYHYEALVMNAGEQIERDSLAPLRSGFFGAKYRSVLRPLR